MKEFEEFIQEEEKKDPEDWTFDFDIYGDDEKTEEEDKAIALQKRPIISGLKARFSSGQQFQEKFAEMEMQVTKWSIKVGARTQDINDLWQFFSIVSEYWDNIRNTYGSLDNDNMIKIKRNCVDLMEEHSTGAIPSKVHNNLIYFNSTVYRTAGLGNFRFEVEKYSRGVRSQARRKIMQWKLHLTIGQDFQVFLKSSI